MSRALDETVILGVPTTQPYHKNILKHDAFKRGDVDTGFIAKYGDDLKDPPSTPKVSHIGTHFCMATSDTAHPASLSADQAIYDGRCEGSQVVEEVKSCASSNQIFGHD
jgi:acetyl/propionyl-CoA carboxylase alpha subunit